MRVSAWIAVVMLVPLASSPWIGRYGWLLDFPTFFYPQIALATLGLAAAMVAFRRWVPAAAVAALLILEATQLAAGWFRNGDAAPATNPGQSLKVLTFNVFAENRSPERLSEYLRAERPDIVLLQEVYAQWYAAFGRLHDLYPYRTNERMGRRTSLVILSRFPLLDVELARAVPEQLPAGINNAILCATIEVAGQRVSLMTVHAPTPRSAMRWAGRNAYLKGLAGRVTRTSSPMIVAGDWNTSPWSFWARSLLENSILHDAGARSWPQATRVFEERASAVAGTLIDRVLASPAIVPKEVQVVGSLGSDHRAVLVQLELTRDASSSVGDVSGNRQSQ